MDGTTGPLINWIVGGGSAGASFFILRLIIILTFGRIKDREASIDATTEFLIDELKEQVRLLGDRLTLAEEHHINCLQELAELKGFVYGQGNARQEAQLIIAAEKAQEKDK